MKFLSFGKDGGAESRVWGFWLVEIKSLFSIALLRFEDGTRDAYHEHAFNCFSWVLSGFLLERFFCGKQRRHVPSWRPFVTRREDFHKVRSFGRTWVLTVRGPWRRTWREYADGVMTTLTHGRREVFAQTVDERG